ncbi:MAG: hypothetical protein Q9209_003936 [Squamulea sp. 1 TL-2023]
MDLLQLQCLEELVNDCTRSDQEPTDEDLARWQALFGYSACDAHDIITKLRADINHRHRRLSDEQWSLIKVEKEAEGYDRESYEHQLQLWVKPNRPIDSQRFSGTFIFRLEGPFQDIHALRSAVGISAEPRKGHGEEGDAEFAVINGDGKRAIEAWLEKSSTAWRPTLVRLSKAPKDLSDTSMYPTLGLDSTLPHHRANSIDQGFVPTQNELPVWYFFYGTLMDPETLQKCIGLTDLPTMVPASIKGGALRGWKRKYKGLVDGPADAQVDGYAYRIETVDQEDFLRFRETTNYEVVRCRIMLNGREGTLGLTFRFADPSQLDVD